MTNREYKTYLKALVNIISFVVALLLCIWLIPKGIIFFMPFVIGWIIAMLAAPIVKALEKRIKIKRKMGSAVVIILVLALVVFAVYGIISRLVHELIQFYTDFPQIWTALGNELNSATTNLYRILNRLPLEMREGIYSIIDAITGYFSGIAVGGNSATNAMTALGNIVNKIPQIILAIVMTLLSSYFFVAEKEGLSKTFEKYIPGVIRYRLDMLKRSFAKAFGGYFKAQLKIEVWIYLILIVGLLILKIRYAVLVALIIAFMDFLPVFGAGTIMIPWVIIKLLDGEYYTALGLFIVWGVGQIVRQLIQPKIVGDSMGMPPIPTLILIYVGFTLGGVVGMIISVPLGIIVLSLYEEGVFNTTIESVRILVVGFNRFRCFRTEDKKMIEEFEKEISVEEKIESKDRV